MPLDLALNTSLAESDANVYLLGIAEFVFVLISAVKLLLCPFPISRIENVITKNVPLRKQPAVSIPCFSLFGHIFDSPWPRRLALFIFNYAEISFVPLSDS